MKTLFKFLALLILLHMADCTIECYQTRSLIIVKDAPNRTATSKGCILPRKEFEVPKWARLIKK